VRGYGDARWAPADVPVLNPAFDVTPVSLIESLVLDRGVFSRSDLSQGLSAALLGRTSA
jgi:methylthioribose-1-phosphate isomerase